MSATLLGEIWPLELGPIEKLLLAYLADGADHHGNVSKMPAQDLSEICGRSPKTTRTALKALADAGLLVRGPVWHVCPYALGREDNVTVAAQVQRRADKPTEPAPGSQTLAEDPPTANDLTTRLAAFCAAWGLSSPSNKLVKAWEALEAAEAKHNRPDKHKDPETGKQWSVTVESIADLFPEIEHAVAVFQSRAEQGLPNHADSPVQFVELQLWLAPEYQVPLADIGPESVIDEAELNAMVMEMNRAGGAFQCHLLMTSKNPHTGELETETLKVYEKRVLAKYREFQDKKAFFEE